jgi:hypothetical protein
MATGWKKARGGPRGQDVFQEDRQRAPPDQRRCIRRDEPHAQLWSEDGLDHLAGGLSQNICCRKINISGLFQSEMGLFQTTLSCALPETFKLKLNESSNILFPGCRFGTTTRFDSRAFDGFVRSPLFGHEKNPVSSPHAQHVDEIDRGTMKIIKIAPNFRTIAKREAKKIDTSSNVAHTDCAHRCFANGLR